MVHPAGGETLRIGIIGSGGRGTGAAIDAVESSQNVVISAVGDVFQERVDSSSKELREKIGDKFKATPETCFSGFDCYQKVLASDIDMVILAAPPGMRPLHLKAAVEAGKHIFMEKPVAVDPVGVRSIIESSELAAQKGLGIVAGTQRRHTPSYIETIKRIHDGAIGEVMGGQCYWCQEELWVKEHKPEWTDMQWQMRNWLYFDWLSGDHIVEQHVHNLDVINWVMGGPPVKALGMGGREVRKGTEYGNVFDHFAIEYEYANGARVQSFCRQTKGASSRVAEYVFGTKGRSDPNGVINGANAYKYEGKEDGRIGYLNEHADLIKSIRDGKPLNEGRRIAESTLTAIMGRMSAYTGRELSWKWVMNSSKLDLTPANYDMGSVVLNPVPVPGQTPLV